MQWPLKASMKGFFCCTALLNSCFNIGEVLYNPLTFVSFLTLRPEVWQSLPCPVAFWGWNLSPYLNYVCICIDLLLLSRNRKFFRYFVFTYCSIIWLGSCPEVITAFIPWKSDISLIFFDRSLTPHHTPPTPNYAFCISFYPACFFFSFIADLHKGDLKKKSCDRSILGRFQIFAKKYRP